MTVSEEAPVEVAVAPAPLQPDTLEAAGYSATVSLSTGQVVNAFIVQQGGTLAVRVNGLNIATAGTAEALVTIRAADGTVVAQDVCPELQITPSSSHVTGAFCVILHGGTPSTLASSRTQARQGGWLAARS